MTTKIMTSKIAKHRILNYEVGKLNSDVSNFDYDISIRQALQNVDRNAIEAIVTKIAGMYLNANVKSRSITDAFTVNLLIEHIFEECGNLELQEIEYIFKNGIKGKFGTIYNDISIDTICGIDGWIEVYYKDHRKYRKEIDKTIHTQTEIEEQVTGELITIEEFYKRNPDALISRQISDIVIKARQYKCSLIDVLRYYELNGLNQLEMNEDILVLKDNYLNIDENLKICISEHDYVLRNLNDFIIKNKNKIIR